MEFILILIGILWALSPFPLLFLWLKERKARKKTQAAMRDFLSGARPSPSSAVNRPPVMPQNIPVPQPVSEQTDETAAAPASPIIFAPPIAAAQASPVYTQPVPAEPAPQLPDAPDTLPETEPVSVPEAPAAETPAVPAAAYTPPAAPAPYPQSPYGTPPQPVRKAGIQVSAITVMLAVGVVLIVAAGLMFVLSQWESFSNSGKLATLAAGSVLFFGASAVSRKVFSLERTGMAFFVIGTAFLPISVWAAGCFGLLGEGLDNPQSNLLIAFSFLSFTIAAFIAVRMYMQIGWGIGFLLGLTGTYLYFARALLAPDKFTEDFHFAMFLLFSSVWALLLAYLSRTVRDYCPLPIARALEPFAIGFAFLNAVFMLTLCAADGDYMLYGAASLLAAAVFFAPVLIDRLKNFTAIPVACTALLGFFLLFEPLHTHEADESAYLFYSAAFPGLVLMICALLFLVLLLTSSLPEHCRRGFMIGSYVFTVVSLFPQLGCDANLPLILVLCVMLAVTVILALRAKDGILKGIAGAELAVLCIDISAAQNALTKDGARLLLVAGLLLVCFLLLTATKRMRTVFSDLLLLVMSSLYAASAMDDAALRLNGEVNVRGRAVFYIAFAVLLVITAIYWFLATARESCKPYQYIFAALLPLTLGTAAYLLADAEQVSIISPVCFGWSIVSYAFGLLAYYTTKKRFNGVRRLLFLLGIIPPMIVACFTEQIVREDVWYLPMLLLASAAALIVWRIFANRGFRGLSVAGFAVSLWFVLEATWYGVNRAMFASYSAHSFSFTVWMLTAVWIIVLSILAIVIRHGSVRFVGSDAIPAVMQVVAPATALLFSCILISLTAIEWAALCAVFTIAMCVLAWCTTKKTQFILPGLSGLGLIITLEAIREHVPWKTYSEGNRDGAVIFMLVCFAVLTLLLPYIGKVLREAEQPNEETRRSYVFTAMGGLIPAWAICSVCDRLRYTADERSWIRFFVPVLAAGFLLHFVREAKTESAKKGFFTASAAFVTVAFWMQPFLQVDHTYWEDKLHLLPLLGFAVVLRLLYGKETGGYLLFAAGVYSMLRLGAAAITSDSLADFLTVLICALAIFLVSFYVKQKKWFLLGGVSLIVIVLYLRTKLSMNWWGFLLIAGLLLIGVAGANETFKKRGESLKEKAGRMWEDWRW